MKVDMELCLRCGACVGTCNDTAIRLYESGIVFHMDICVRCGSCMLVCPVGAISEEVGV
ncbi:MAG: 4Fe-4S binding protein [Candidatus Thermoplasmatota archaeon]|jgi:NAD-dependent dihydropyrimidine dehydrogenase PreA subunit|nr:4Fe-4S binding protein [Candidatus Thermoplasmatota archaeon]